MTEEEYEWEWQRLSLDRELANIDGDAFETLFQRIAKAAWEDDFTPTIPMGRRGDLKCDGYRHSTGTVHQCFAPRYGQANVESTLAKIAADFEGAREHWGGQLKMWIFIVNLYRDKVPSEIVRHIEELSKRLGIPARIWTREEILKMAESLRSDRERLFGRAPARQDMTRITYADIGRALAAIKRDLATDPLEPVQLPPELTEKMEWNELAKSTRHFLGIGLAAAEKVRRYLMDRCEPEESQKMADAFKDRYSACRFRGLEPDKIFGEMVIYAGGGTGESDREAAALAIVTHFFSTCEIFETPPAAAASI
jgi:hypothetical protein